MEMELELEERDNLPLESQSWYVITCLTFQILSSQLKSSLF